MPAPKFNIVRKNKKTKANEKVGAIWLNENDDGSTFMSLQLFTEKNEKYKQVPFGALDNAKYFYNVYENTPREEREAEPEDTAWEESETEEEF